MKITYQDQNEISIVTLNGEFTGEDAGRFRRVVLERLENEARDFVLDAEYLEAIDSSGLEAFLWLQDQCAERLGQVRIANPPSIIHDALKATRLDGRLECLPSVDAAVQSLGVHHV